MSQFISTMIPDPDNHIRRDGKLESCVSWSTPLTSCSIYHAKGHWKAIRHGSEL